MKRLIVLLIALSAFATACLGGNVFSLTAGDCFDDPDTFSEVTDVKMVDCTEPHDNEAYATFDLSDSSYPGDLAVQTEGSVGCLDRFDAYVGRDYASSALDFSMLLPTSQSWDQGDQEVVCFLYDINGAKLSTSARNSGL